MYCSRRATSALSTYFPISRRNCSIEVYGRYSLNSRSIRGPMPGIARIWASVAVLRLILVMAPVLAVVPPVVPAAAVPVVPVVVPAAGVVVVADVVVAVDDMALVSPVMAAVVSAPVSDLVLH